MQQPRLYCPDLCPGTLELPPEESRHLVSSLRASPGSEVVLFDGAGGEAAGVLQRVDRRRAQVVVGRVTRRPFELAHRLTLAVAMGRAHRQGYLVEKCTELGVAAIWPIVAARSVARPDKDAVARWSRRPVPRLGWSAFEIRIRFDEALELHPWPLHCAVQQAGPGGTVCEAPRGT